MPEILKTNIISKNQYLGEVVLVRKSDLIELLGPSFKKYLTVREAAEYLRISERNLRNLIKNNKIPFYRLEGKILFKISELDKFIEKNKVESISEIIQRATNRGK